MTSKLVRDAKRGKAITVLAHRDTERFVFRDIKVPNVVPLYANFNQAKRVGTAHLKPQQGLVYALIYLDFPGDFGESPSVVLALSGAVRVTEDGVTYAQNGEVTAASIVNPLEWATIYGTSGDTE